MNQEIGLRIQEVRKKKGLSRGFGGYVRDFA